MPTQDAKDALFGARLFYNGITILTLATFFYYDNNLRKSILSFDVLYFLPYFALVGISYYLYYACGKDPGFVPLNQTSETQHIELSVAAQEGSESLLPSQTGTSSSVGVAIDLERPPIKEAEEKNENNHVIQIKKNKGNNAVMPEMWFCDKCNVTQPYRAKHCKLCERCVHKFDHHCFWIGGCVGELNHRTFWLFLFFQTILEIWSYFIADSGLDASYQLGTENMKTGASTSNSPYTTSDYGAFMTTTVVMIGASLFTGLLLVFHTFLILSNQTTWELAKKDRISYLKIYPKSFYPFSEGLIGNIKLIFFHGNRLRDWELPPTEFVRREQKGFNWCENEYWSCC